MSNTPHSDVPWTDRRPSFIPLAWRISAAVECSEPLTGVELTHPILSELTFTRCRGSISRASLPQPLPQPPLQLMPQCYPVYQETTGLIGQACRKACREFAFETSYGAWIDRTRGGIGQCRTKREKQRGSERAKERQISLPSIREDLRLFGLIRRGPTLYIKCIFSAVLFPTRTRHQMVSIPSSTCA
jgi:hypothetical protein